MTATVIPLHAGPKERREARDTQERRALMERRMESALRDWLHCAIPQLNSGSPLRASFKRLAARLEDATSARPGEEGDDASVSVAAIERRAAFLRGETAVLPEDHPLHTEYMNQILDLEDRGERERRATKGGV